MAAVELWLPAAAAAAAFLAAARLLYGIIKNCVNHCMNILKISFIGHDEMIAAYSFIPLEIHDL